MFIAKPAARSRRGYFFHFKSVISTPPRNRLPFHPAGAASRPACNLEIICRVSMCRLNGERKCSLN